LALDIWLLMLGLALDAWLGFWYLVFGNLVFGNLVLDYFVFGI
jgi:hypothetical protein